MCGPGYRDAILVSRPCAGGRAGLVCYGLFDQRNYHPPGPSFTLGHGGRKSTTETRADQDRGAANRGLKACQGAMHSKITHKPMEEGTKSLTRQYYGVLRGSKNGTRMIILHTGAEGPYRHGYGG